MTENDLKMLRLLSESPQPVGHLGELLWGTVGRKPQHYARPAGKVLKRLERQGFAVWVPGGRDMRWGWVITASGEEALEEADGR